MPWLSIFMAILSFLTSLKKNPEKKGQAVAAAALAGLGTYYVTHETDWGKENLGSLDGVVPNVTPAPGDGVTLADGSTAPKSNSSMPTKVNGSTTGVWDVIKSWGPAGTAAVIGTAGVATGAFDLKKYLPWIVGGVAAFLIFSK